MTRPATSSTTTSGRWTFVGDAPATSQGRIQIGPEGDSLPASFTGTYSSTEAALKLTLKCRWGGERVVVDEVAISGRDGRPITPRDMASIELAGAVYVAAVTYAEPARGAVHFEDRSGRRPTPDELRHVAAVYTFQYAAWGRPRQRVMDMWKLPRSTANSWIRKARQLYPEMPGEDGDR